MKHKIAFLILGLLFTPFILPASDTTLLPNRISLHSISITSLVNGNGFGMQYVQSSTFLLGKKTLLFGGLTFMVPNRKISGFQFGTGFILVNENESSSGHLLLASIISVRNFRNVTLSQSAIEYEKQISPNLNNSETSEINTIRFSAWEYAASISLNYHLRFGLQLQTSIGFDYTNSRQITSTQINLSRSNSVYSIELSAGLGWAFGKLMSKKDHELKMIAEETEEENLFYSRN